MSAFSIAFVVLIQLLYGLNHPHIGNILYHELLCVLFQPSGLLEHGMGSELVGWYFGMGWSKSVTLMLEQTS